MIWNQPTPKIAKPCSRCMILAMNAGLEYLDGKDANTDTNMWLHHVCSNKSKDTANSSQRWFCSTLARIPGTRLAEV
jgi:hypothetical protein